MFKGSSGLRAAALWIQDWWSQAAGTNHVFITSKKVLYFSDVRNDTVHVNINTVDSIQKNYTVEEYANACKAHCIQDIKRRPTTKECIKYIDKGLILSWPITKHDFLRAGDILGPKIRCITGKTTRKTLSKVILNALENLPEGMLEERRNMTLNMDIIYINKIPFIIKLSGAIWFGTTETMKDERKSTIMKSLQQVINTYNSMGFRIKHILSYRQFECIRNQLKQQALM